jgi:hypothetical protein
MQFNFFGMIVYAVYLPFAIVSEWVDTQKERRRNEKLYGEKITNAERFIKFQKSFIGPPEDTTIYVKPRRTRRVSFLKDKNGNHNNP